MKSRKYLLAGAAAIAFAVLAGSVSCSASAKTRDTNAIASSSDSSPRPSAGLEGTLAFPFKKSDADGKIVDSQGWNLAPDEAFIFGEDPKNGHQAVDFEGMPYGTPVLAVADGWAWQSFQSGAFRTGGPFDPNDPSNPDTIWRDPFTGHEGYLGYSGLFVELQTTVVDKTTGAHVVAQYFHLASASKKLPIAQSVKLDDTTDGVGHTIQNWNPVGILKTQAEMRKQATFVHKGDVIGYLGDSGINFGYNDKYDPKTNTVAPRDRKALPPWDVQGAGYRKNGGYSEYKMPVEQDAQLHLQFYNHARTEANGYAKGPLFDPFDLADKNFRTGKTLYGAYGSIPSRGHSPFQPKGRASGLFEFGPRSVWQHTAGGRPIYADQK